LAFLSIPNPTPGAEVASVLGKQTVTLEAQLTPAKKGPDHSLNIQAPAEVKYLDFKETDKPASSLPKLPVLTLVGQQQKLAASQQTAKMQRKQEKSLADEINDDLHEAEQLTPVFTTRGGIQVQFVTSTPYATIDRHREPHRGVAIHYPQCARIVDQFGMTYYVSVKFEGNIPLSLEELVKKCVFKEWS